jgi:phosphohistidine phosphatase
MYLVLMRHGVAEEGTPDETRRLTRKGERRVRTMAQLLDRLDFRPNIVLSSPLVRAVETARAVVKEIDLETEIVETPTLKPDGEWDAFAEFLNERLKGAKSSTVVLAVGHMPNLDVIASLAVHGRLQEFEIAKGAVVGIRFRITGIEPGAGELRFYLTPSLAKRI